jgi:hypothetical protein
MHDEICYYSSAHPCSRSVHLGAVNSLWHGAITLAASFLNFIKSYLSRDQRYTIRMTKNVLLNTSCDSATELHAGCQGYQ